MFITYPTIAQAVIAAEYLIQSRDDIPTILNAAYTLLGYGLTQHPESGQYISDGEFHKQLTTLISMHRMKSTDPPVSWSNIVTSLLIRMEGWLKRSSSSPP